MNPVPPFSLIVQHLPVGVVLLDEDALILYMNPAAEKLTGSNTQEARGNHWKDVFSIRIDDPAREQTGSLIDILLERPILITKAGIAVPVELHISQIEDEQGKSNGSILVFHDLTDLNVETEGLKESRAKYKRLVNAIEGIVWEADGETMKFRYVSDYAEKLLGYSPKNWQKDPGFWQRIIHPGDRESVQNVLGNALRQKEDYQIEFRVMTADGRILLVRDSVTLSADDDQIRLAGVVTDITMSKQARDILVKSEERFSAAFYANPMALLLTTELGVILDANESYERMTGFFREDLLDRSIVETGLCSGDDLKTLIRMLQERAQADNVKFQSRTKSGDVRTVEAFFRKIILGGEPCLLGVLQDIT